MKSRILLSLLVVFGAAVLMSGRTSATSTVPPEFNMWFAVAADPQFSSGSEDWKTVDLVVKRINWHQKYLVEQPGGAGLKGVVVLGDLTYNQMCYKDKPAGEGEFGEYRDRFEPENNHDKRLKVPQVWVGLGNHDFTANEPWGQYKKECADKAYQYLSERHFDSGAPTPALIHSGSPPGWYSWNWGPVHLVQLHVGCDPGLGISSSQCDAAGAWLKSDLSSLPPATPVIVLSHYPPPGSDDWGGGWQKLEEAVQSSGANVVAHFHGHNHDFYYRPLGMGSGDPNEKAPSIGVTKARDFIEGNPDHAPGFALVQIYRKPKENIAEIKVWGYYCGNVHDKDNIPSECSEGQALGLELAYDFAPAVTVSGPDSVNEGEAASYEYSVFDRVVDEGSYDRAVDLAPGHPDCAGDPPEAHNPVYDPDGNIESGEFECRFPDGPYGGEVGAKAVDESGWTGDDSLSVQILNVEPSVTPAQAQEACAGEPAMLDLGSFTDPGVEDSPWTLDVAWGDGSAAADSTGVQGEITPISHTYASPGTYDVTVTVTDKDGGVGQASFEVLVSTPPTADAGPDQMVDEGDLVTLTGSFSDPDPADTHTFLWQLESSTNGQSVADVTTEQVTFTPNDNGAYTFSFTVTDNHGCCGTDTVVVTAENVAPLITATGDTIDENGVATVSGTITDPGTEDTFTVVIDWGEGTPETFSYPAGTTSYSETHQYLDDNPTGTPSDDYAVNVSIEDDDGGTGSASTTVTVNNVDPVVSIDSITDENGAEIGADVPVALINTEVDVAGHFTDIGTKDTHTASIDWGDGNSDDLGAVTGSISATHVYSDPCDCTITLTVTDDDTGTDAPSRQITVVDAAGAVDEVIDHLIPGEGDPNVAKAIAKLRGEKGGHASNGALDMLEKDNLNAALEKIKQALEYLEAAEAADPGLDFTHQKGVLSLAAKSVAVGAIDQAELAASKPNELQKVQQARDLVTEGDGLRLAGDYVGAVDKYQEAVRKVQGIA